MGCLSSPPPTPASRTPPMCRIDKTASVTWLVCGWTHFLCPCRPPYAMYAVFKCPFTVLRPSTLRAPHASCLLPSPRSLSLSLSICQVFYLFIYIFFGQLTSRNVDSDVYCDEMCWLNIISEAWVWVCVSRGTLDDPPGFRPASPRLAGYRRIPAQSKQLRARQASILSRFPVDAVPRCSSKPLKRHSALLFLKYFKNENAVAAAVSEKNESSLNSCCRSSWMSVYSI